ncbi:MAG: hypothetical protein JJE04_25035 [Acidobacteriia bacterium]|nr:hypothetical protein [Terriglobia bacterium]
MARYAAQRKSFTAESKKVRAEAEPLFQRALALAEKILGPTNPGLDVFLQDYAAFLRQSKRKRQSQVIASRLSAIRSASGKTNTAPTIDIRELGVR